MYILPQLSLEEIAYYLRKSRADDPNMTVEEVLTKHEERLDALTERLFPGKGRVPEANRFREIVSGETIDSRPKIQELLRKAESPKIKAIMCVEPQRLSRGDLEDIGRLVKLLRYSDTIVITEQYTYDLRDARDRDDFERELKRGNEFLEYTKRIMFAGRKSAVEKGNYIGTKPPYGYDKIVYKDGNRKCHSLAPNPEQAKIVKLIFEMYRDGFGSHRIARTLNEMGVKTATGVKWSPESLKKMRTNQHYIGMVVWNRRRTVKTVEEGEVVASRPVNEDYMVFPGKHEPIIDMDLWNAVQEIRDKIPPVKSRKKHANEFAGLIYCKCGRPLSRRQYKRNGEERTGPRLLCDNQPECGTASCFVEEMRTAVIEILQEAIADFELRIKNNSSDSVTLHRELVERLEKRLADLNKLEIAQWEKYTLEDMPKHIFDQLNEKVRKEKEETEQALCTAKDTLPEPIDYENKKAMFSTALEALRDPDVPTLQKNLLLKRCIERIDYSRARKGGGNRRWGEPEPMELEVHLKV